MRYAHKSEVLRQGYRIALFAPLAAHIRAIRFHRGVVAPRLAVPFGPAQVGLAELPDPLTRPHAAQVEYLSQPSIVEAPLPKEDRCQ